MSNLIISSEKANIRYKQSTKMKCPICDKELFIYSYENTHKNSSRCKRRVDNPIAKKPSDKIRCCERCDYVNSYSNMTRIKKHRLNCIFYNSCLSTN